MLCPKCQYAADYVNCFLPTEALTDVIRCPFCNHPFGTIVQILERLQALEEALKNTSPQDPSNVSLSSVSVERDKHMITPS